MNRLLQEIFCDDQSSVLCTDTKLQLRDILALLHKREISEQEGETRFRYLIRDNTDMLNTFDEYISKSKSEKVSEYIFSAFLQEKSVPEESRTTRVIYSFILITDANFHRIETIVQSLEDEQYRSVFCWVPDSVRNACMHT